jgi:hypothetical protein
MFLAFLSMLGLFGKGSIPEIKEGEFNFILTYVVDGEIDTIEGTYICKFEKLEYYLDGVSRQWTGYIKGHKDSTTYTLKSTDDAVIKVELDISPEFFMADPHYKANENTDEPKPEPYLYILTSDGAENEYKGNLYVGDDVKIISFKYDKPIENTYK